MDKLDSNATSSKLQKNAYVLLIRGDYFQAAKLYEQAIADEPDVKSNYWYLGLILLLQGQEVEAQTTWFIAMMAGDVEQVNNWNVDLMTVLNSEAERREHLEEYAIAARIRQNIRQFAPQDIDNLLHLILLSTKLKTFSGENLQEMEIIQVLKSQPLRAIELKFLMLVIDEVLICDPIHPLCKNFIEACLPYFKENCQDLLDLILPHIVNIACFHRKPRVSLSLADIYLRLDPDNTEILGYLPSFYQTIHEFDKSIEIAKQLYSLVESLPEKVFANRHVLQAIISAGGNWQAVYPVNQKQQELLADLIQENSQEIEHVKAVRLLNSNFYTPYIEDNPRKFRNIQNRLLQLCKLNNARYAKEQLTKYAEGNSLRKRQIDSGKKLKIGYISHCLRSHSVGWLARWLLHYHDRDKFQVNGYFVNGGSPFDQLHQWYINQMDRSFVSNNVWSLAEEIYQDEIDILVDLDSITIDVTCEILMLKPAPIQVTWLGWDASGNPSIDYFIADPYVLPESAQEYYSEKIWRLPQTYIAVDGFEIGVPTINRDQLDIPDDAIVYLSSQMGFKRHPDHARLQLNIIKEVPNSYLLIKGVSDQKSLKTFFYELAEQEGVDGSKLRFLGEAPTEAAHRANLSIADVSLDTYPYNGATTTLETLWMCVPLVTKVGEQYAARNSYTMMMNAGISEGIAWSDQEYIEWGVRLGKDEVLRQQISWKLKLSRRTSPLWNSKEFTGEMEKAYEKMWKNYIETK